MGPKQGVEQDRGGGVEDDAPAVFDVSPAGMIELVQDQATGEIVNVRINWMGIVQARVGAVMVLDMLEQSLRSTGWRIESVMSIPPGEGGA